jgi:hypothetical protein
MLTDPALLEPLVILRVVNAGHTRYDQLDGLEFAMNEP